MSETRLVKWYTNTLMNEAQNKLCRMVTSEVYLAADVERWAEKFNMYHHEELNSRSEAMDEVEYLNGRVADLTAQLATRTAERDGAQRQISNLTTNGMMREDKLNKQLAARTAECQTATEYVAVCEGIEKNLASAIAENEDLTLQLAARTDQRDELKSLNEHSNQFYSLRYDRLAAWYRKNLTEAQQTEVFGIHANGGLIDEHPRTAQIINMAKWDIHDLKQQLTASTARCAELEKALNSIASGIPTESPLNKAWVSDDDWWAIRDNARKPIYCWIARRTLTPTERPQQ